MSGKGKEIPRYLQPFLKNPVVTNELYMRRFLFKTCFFNAFQKRGITIRGQIATYFIFTLLFMGIAVLSAQDEDFHFDRLTLQDGLPDEDVRHIMQDRQGFLWFATANGIARYDGHEYKIFQYHPLNDASLSASSATGIYEDRSGHLWVATVNYLNRFDPAGEQFERFTGLGQYGRINILYQSRSGHYYIGTENSGLIITDDIDGLNDRGKASQNAAAETVVLQHHFVDADGVNMPISAFYEDPFGNIWIGTKGRGLNKLSPAFTKGQILDGFELTPYLHNAGDTASLSSDVVTAIAEDRAGRMWVGTAAGLNELMNVEADGSIKFRRHQYQPKNPNSINHPFIHSLLVDRLGDLWIGTSNGLCKLQKNSFQAESNLAAGQRYTIYRLQLSSNQHGMRAGRITAMWEDQSGMIWLGSGGAGIYKLDARKSFFEVWQLQASPGEKELVSSVTAVLAESDQSLWLGTDRGSLIRVNLRNRPTSRDMLRDYATFQLQGGNIYSILEADEKHLLVGSSSGLVKFSKQAGSSLSYRYLPEKRSDGIPVYQIFRDSRGLIWLATGKGLHQIDSTGNVTSYLPDANNALSLAWPGVWTVFEDRQGFIWTGTKFGGISRLDPKTGKFINQPHNSISSIFQDQSGSMWFGSYSSGVSKLLSIREDGMELQHYLREDGLPSNHIKSMSGDKQGNLWLSTTNGLSRFYPATESFRNYPAADELRGIKFNRGAAIVSSDEALIFGGNRGLVKFYPEEMKETSLTPGIVLSEFRKQNVRAILEKPISEADTIYLSYDDDIVTFKFAALDFRDPDNNQYAYRLDGLNDDWVYSGNQNSATFMNLEPGSYTLRVKASNSYGIWNEQGIAIALVVTPPWWHTWWFRLAMLAIFLGISGTVFFVRRQSIKRQKQELENLVALRTRELEDQKYLAEEAKRIIEQQAQKLIEADQMKSRFFTNISHEFRTPLSLIIGPLKEMLNANGSNGHSQSKHLGVMYRNSQRLLDLINQLLEISKLESGDMKLAAEDVDLLAFLQPIYDSYLSEADRKQIDYDFLAGSQRPFVHIDKVKFEKVIYNLLSNAFKFTPDFGKVTLAVEESNGRIMIGVTDSGIGIPEDQLQLVFDRFYQADAPEARSFGGTGLGLALSKELVMLHDGTIEAESLPGKGSRFIVCLPATARSNHAVMQNGHSASVPLNGISAEAKQLENPGMQTNKIDRTFRKPQPAEADATILAIVEDNQDILDYLVGHFSKEFEIVTANNGLSGLELVRNKIPDLVISDVMMPGKDGYQLCDALKRDEITCHIPVILLTAKAAKQDKIDGLQLGADAYITKPFEIEEVKVRVGKLIEQRQRLKIRYSRQIFLQPQDIAITSLDEAFLKKLCAFVETHFDDPQLASTALEKQFNMDKRQFQRKVRALTGQTPSQFIRSMRLQRARKLIENNAGSISEIAFQTGFNNLSYFARSFRKQFGHLPSELKK